MDLESENLKFIEAFARQLGVNTPKVDEDSLARLELPDGYVFGTSHSSDAGNPITEAGTLVFDVGRNDNSGRNTGGVVGSGSIAVCVLRQQGMSLNAVKIDDSDPPDRKMY